MERFKGSFFGIVWLAIIIIFNSYKRDLKNFFPNEYSYHPFANQSRCI